MAMRSEGDTITCDCGFSFQRGHSGKHECADGLRAKLAAAVRREEGMKAIVDVMGLRITELEQRQQQPAYPEKLPCAVHLLPGLKLGKGVATKTLLEALARRERYNAGMASMTLEQQADHEDAVNVIKAMLPAPAVPEEVAAALDWIDDFIARCNGDDRGACNSVNVLLAAMLQPVSQGYMLNSPVIPDGWKLVPKEPTTKQWAAGLKAMDGGIDKVTLAYRAMVEVAPSPGGSDDGHATAT